MSKRTRRGLCQAGGILALGALAGCVQWSGTIPNSDPPVVDRFVFRSDTGETEPVIVYSVHCEPETSPWIARAVHDAPASGEVTVVGVSKEPGFYSVYGEAQNHGTRDVAAFNSYDDDDGPTGNVQVEFVVQRNGSMWSNVNGSGAEIAIPGPGN
ncbi:hypothetical protein [Natronomonas sp. EA1]|uniref:hypothetical protein n=1 Tax=Natronomonas sp. EA1 TaxID=3421655 RepID=UPI003EBF9AB8